MPEVRARQRQLDVVDQVREEEPALVHLAQQRLAELLRRRAPARCRRRTSRAACNDTATTRAPTGSSAAPRCRCARRARSDASRSACARSRRSASTWRKNSCELRVVVHRRAIDARGFARRAGPSRRATADRRARAASRRRATSVNALNACSKTRRAIGRRPYFSLISSPCSVMRRRPRRAPSGPLRTSTSVRPPPRSTPSPWPWNSVRSMPACIGRGEQRLLRLAQQPARHDDAAFLVARRVADHHVLMIGATDAGALRYAGSLNSCVMISPQRAQRRGRFEQRRDVGRHVARAAIRRIGPARQQQHRQHVVDAARGADDVRPDRIGAVAMPAVRQRLEHPQAALAARIEHASRALRRAPALRAGARCAPRCCATPTADRPVPAR